MNVKKAQCTYIIIHIEAQTSAAGTSRNTVCTGGGHLCFLSALLCVVPILGLAWHDNAIYAMDYMNMDIYVTCVDAEDVSSTSAMLEHLKQKHPRAAGFIGSCGAVKHFRLVWRCGSVAPWSVCVTCWEPRWSVCWTNETCMLFRYWQVGRYCHRLSSSTRMSTSLMCFKVGEKTEPMWKWNLTLNREMSVVYPL